MKNERDIESIIRGQAMDASMLDREEEIALVNAWHQDRDEESRDKLIEAHQKLVMGMARKFERFNVPFSDLFNEGMIGLMVACEKFVPEKGNRFATYAQWWVLTYLQEAVQRDTCPVRIGKTRKEKAVFRALVRARKRYGQDLSQEVREKIAGAFEIDLAEVDTIDAATGIKSLSLNQSVGGEEEGMEFIDIIADETQGAEAMLKSTLEDKQKHLLGEVLMLLDERERLVIKARFLDDGNKTLRDLAEELNISAERVRQIEREGLHSLRRFINRQGYNSDDLVGVEI